MRSLVITAFIVAAASLATAAGNAGGKKKVTDDESLNSARLEAPVEGSSGVGDRTDIDIHDRMGVGIGPRGRVPDLYDDVDDQDMADTSMDEEGTSGAGVQATPKPKRVPGDRLGEPEDLNGDKPSDLDED